MSKKIAPKKSKKAAAKKASPFDVKLDHPWAAYTYKVTLGQDLYRLSFEYTESCNRNVLPDTGTLLMGLPDDVFTTDDSGGTSFVMTDIVTGVTCGFDNCDDEEIERMIIAIELVKIEPLEVKA